MTDQVKAAASALIMQIEGVRLVAYRDSGGIPTVGVGHTKNVIEGESITMAQAQAFLVQDLYPIFGILDAKQITSPTKCLAYTSFGFNCGTGALGRVLDVSDRIDNPRHVRDAHGVVLNGLVSRRNLEMALLVC